MGDVHDAAYARLAASHTSFSLLAADGREVAIHCRTCRVPWPCDVRLALDEIDGHHRELEMIRDCLRRLYGDKL